jgi:hypothetical protein
MLNADTLAPTFRKSSFSMNGECVEVADKDASILVRDSKLCGEEVLSFPSLAWREFLQRIYSIS